MGRAQVGRKETAVTGANAFMTHASARQPAGQYAQKRGANAKMAPLSCPSVTRHPSPVTRQFSCQTVCWRPPYRGFSILVDPVTVQCALSTHGLGTSVGTNEPITRSTLISRVANRIGHPPDVLSV